MKKRDLTRITINVPTQLLKEIDRYAEKTGLTRTTAISFLCGMYLTDITKAEDMLGIINPGE